MLARLEKAFKSFHSHDVRYVVIGGIAAIIHGVPRATLDLDILIEASRENVERLLAALQESGFGTAALSTPESILENEITFLRDYVRLDIQTSTPGLLFADAWKNKIIRQYEGAVFYVASLDDLLASKRAAGRPIDLEDVRQLEQKQ